MLVFGSREEIAERLASLRQRNEDAPPGITLNIDEYEEEPSAASLDFELNFADQSDAQVILHTLAPPDMPEQLSPGQAAQLAEMLQYIHLRMVRADSIGRGRRIGRPRDAGAASMAESVGRAKYAGGLFAPHRRTE